MSNKLKFVVVCLLLSACEKQIKLDYQPASQLQTKGTVSLGEFKYSPAIVLKPNEVPVRYAQLKIFLDKNVDEYFREAVKSELEFSGISVGQNKNCKLDVVIDEFSVNNGGISAKYKTNATYKLLDASTRAAFEHQGETEIKAYNPFHSHEDGLRESAQTSIQTMLADPKFSEAIKASCQN